MRLAAMACALMVVLCVAVFGAILSQKSSVPLASSSPAQAAPSERTVVTTLEDRDVAPAPAVAARPPSPPDAAQNASPLSAALPSAAPTSTPAAPSVPTVLAQNTPSFAAAPVGAPATTAQAPAPAQATAPAASSSCPGNPNALGVSRVV